MSLTHALKWSFLSELASKLVQPVVFVVLARLLTPEDFGVMSAALMVMAFSQIFWEAGMGKALIQRQTDVEAAANVTFWVNFGLGVIIAGLLYISAKPIAQTFFQDPRVTTVIQVMTLQVFLGALGSVQTALLQKEMGFKKLFWVRLVTASLPGLASLPLAWQGMGYWALVAGTLVGQAAQVVMLWRVSPWRPSWTFRIPVAKEMGRFGAWVGLSGLLAWFYAWIDALIVGMYLGSHDLGLYRTGNQFSTMVFALLFGPIAPVLYSHLSKMNGGHEKIRMAAENVIRILIIVAVPIAMVLFSISETIGSVLFDKEWDGIGFVIGVMALTHGFSWVVSMNGEFYRAMGRPSYETVVLASTLVVYMAGYLFSIIHGFEVFVWMRFFLMLTGLLIQLLVARVLLKVKLNNILGYLIGISAFSFLVQLVLECGLDLFFIRSAVGTIIGAGVSLLIIWSALVCVERDSVVKDVRGFLRQKLQSRIGG